MPSNVVYLIIGNIKFYGWKTASLRISIEDCCRSFEFTLISLSEIQSAILTGGAPCSIYIGEDKFLDGYIDSVRPQFSNDGEIFTIAGRDKSCDFVDSSVNITPYSWKSISLFALATKICNQFGLKVSKNGTFSDDKSNVVLETGETGFEVISKYARARNILITTDENGDLVLGHAGSDLLNDPLIYGENLISFEANNDMRDRFNKYIVKGNSTSGKGNPWGGKSKSLEIVGTATDDEVRSQRVKIISAPGTDTNKFARDRAVFEATSRSSKSEDYTVAVSGFRQSNDELWRCNSLVKIKVIEKGYELDTQLLVSSVIFSISGEGSEGYKTVMTLRRADSYKEFLKPVIKKKKAKSGIAWK